jgi:hypothetical protein
MKRWKAIYTTATKAEHIEITRLLLERLFGCRAIKITLRTVLAMLLAAYVLLVAACIRPLLPALLIKALMVVLVLDAILLAVITVHRVRVGPTLGILFVACQLLLWFALGTSALGNSAPAALVIAAGYGVALSLAISVYSGASMIRALT